METKQFLKTLKIIIILALIIGAIGALFYMIFGVTLLWQAMTAGIITGFLLIMVFILLFLTIYFYFKMLLIRRELTKCREDLEKMATDPEN